MPVVELDAGNANRRQRRARMAKPHAAAMPRPAVLPALEHIDDRRGIPTAPSDPEHAVLLDLFGRPPVVFHRSFVDIAGSVNGALWLSHAMALSQEGGSRGDPSFHLSTKDCFEATGMSLREQVRARKSLRSAGLLLESRRGGGVVAYRLDFERLAQALLDHSTAAWSVPSGGTKAPMPGPLHATAA